MLTLTGPDLPHRERERPFLSTLGRAGNSFGPILSEIPTGQGSNVYLNASLMERHSIFRSGYGDSQEKSPPWVEGRETRIK